MNKPWLILAVILVIVGGLGLGGVTLYKYNWECETDSYKQQYGGATAEYLELYKHWEILSPEEKLKCPWGYGEYGGLEIQKRLRGQRSARLRADIDDLAKGIEGPHALTEMIYGENWPAAVRKYRKKTEILDSLVTFTTAFIFIGLIFITLYGTKKLFGIICDRFNFFIKTKAVVTVHEHDNVTETEKNPESEVTSDTEDTVFSEHKEQKKPLFEKHNIQKGPANNFRPANLPNSPMNPMDVKKFLAEQGVSASEDAKPFSDSIKTSGVATLLATEPVTQGLSELSQEVSAIRDFATKQQDRVRQLQDGYDWTIIKRFCIRIIRCIDNVDERIRKLREQDLDVDGLEDIRDELVFALESSGVEQFEPEIGKDYKGSEKRIEAVRGRETTDDPSLAGRIAEVIKPGYQYVIGDEDVKIVRCAQVKLYC